MKLAKSFLIQKTIFLILLVIFIPYLVSIGWFVSIKWLFALCGTIVILLTIFQYVKFSNSGKLSEPYNRIGKRVILTGNRARFSLILDLFIGSLFLLATH